MLLISEQQLSWNVLLGVMWSRLATCSESRRIPEI